MIFDGIFFIFRISGWKASVKALIISLLLIILNVLINGFVTLNLINNQVLDMNQSNVQTFRIIIAICQLAGSVLCLMIIDFVERKVSKKITDWYFSINEYCLLIRRMCCLHQWRESSLLKYCMV